MSDCLSRLNAVNGAPGWSGFTQICICGTVSLPVEGDGAGKLQLRYHEWRNVYSICASQTAGHHIEVCELLMFYQFYSFTSKSALTKAKLY